MNNLEEVTNYTQDIRRMVVEALIPAGKVPEDPKVVKAILTALKDMDSNVLGIAKLEVEDKAATNAGDIALAMAEMVRNQGNGNIFCRAPDGSAPNAPVLNPEKIGQHEITESMKEIGLPGETSEEFMKRMDAQQKK